MSELQNFVYKLLVIFDCKIQSCCIEGRHLFYGTESKTWYGFWLVANTEKKKFWADYEQLLRVVFSCFQGQIFFSIFLKIFYFG